MVVHFLLLAAAQQFLLDASATGTEREAAKVLFLEIGTDLFRWTRIVAAIGLIVLVGSLIWRFIQGRKSEELRPV